MIAVHCAAHGLKLRGARWRHQMKRRPAKAFFVRVRETFSINALS
jgi:hypothetical protein